jgi:hypothetical protein
VAGDFTQAAVSALGTMPYLQPKKYGFKFTFTSVRGIRAAAGDGEQPKPSNNSKP